VNWLDNRASKLPTQAELDGFYFHLANLIVAALLLAFSFGIVVVGTLTFPRDKRQDLNMHLAA